MKDVYNNDLNSLHLQRNSAMHSTGMRFVVVEILMSCGFGTASASSLVPLESHVQAARH